MKRDLQSVVAEIQNDKAPPLLLLYGDDFRVQTACKTIVDLLVPANQRDLNFERFDGRSAPWDQIDASLMTPPFLPGKKLVWVENAPYFFSREQKGELGEKILQLWHDEKKDDAGKLLLDLLVVEGWTQERWEKMLAASSAQPLVNLLEGDSGEPREEAEGLLAYCKDRGMDLSQRRGSDGHRLFELLEQGLPPWDFLLLTAVQVDRRTRLYKRFDEKNAVLDLGLERDRSGRISRENVADFVNQRLREAGKKIEPQAREMILLRAGEELWAVHQEMEKLFLYVGAEPGIRLGDVEAVFSDQGEGWIFDLTRAVAERDAVAALAHLARLLGQGEHPLRLLGTIAAEMRRLLSARQLIEGEMRGKWKRGMAYPQFQRGVLEQGSPIVTRNPYADYLCFQRAEHFTLAELRRDHERIFEADLRLKSSAGQPRLVMERLVLEMCLESPRPKQPTGDSAGR